MPIYEYRCRACGHSFERLVRSQGGGSPAGGPAPPACPGCRSGDVTRALSLFGVKSGLVASGGSGGGGCGCGAGGCGCR